MEIKCPGYFWGFRGSENPRGGGDIFAKIQDFSKNTGDVKYFQACVLAALLSFHCICTMILVPKTKPLIPIYSPVALVQKSHKQWF